ncbi:MAG TPA: hypothetical protein PLY87_08015 [Planctomycetaceae bacterium]|nr:hypothetical protein [Planctomycetaceae bacterium]HQZ65005.1 hypothetical protein [Planctomycetaceae bacterium]
MAKYIFGDDEDTVYTPAMTLWALTSQTFFSGAQRSCKATVLRVASLWATLGRTVCNTNTGAYCRARQKIPFEVVRDITQQIGRDADAGWAVENARSVARGLPDIS